MKKQLTVQQHQALLKKHQSFIKKFHQFPHKTRKVIYAQLLNLPINHDNFLQLTKQYPILIQHTLDQQVSFIVGALSKNYSDLTIQWLPGIIYPFVRLFRQDSIASFQISLTFLANYIKPLFKDYPNSPKSLMTWFGSHLNRLQQKVNSLDYPLSAIIQPSLLVSLTDVFNKQDWLQLFDFLFSYPYSPWLYICVFCEMIKSLQNQLIKMNTIEKIALTLKKQKNISVKQLIKRAIKLQNTDKKNLKQLYSDIFFPIPKQRYPILIFTEKKRQNNQILQRKQDIRVQQLKEKFYHLSNLMQKRFMHGIAADQKEINNRYEQIDGQMRQYLQRLRQQHQKKITALKQIEKSFKQKLNKSGGLNHQIAREAIQRRGRLQRQIQMARRQANNLRQMEIDLMSRIQDSADIRKMQLLQQNRILKNKQQSLSLSSMGY